MKNSKIDPLKLKLSVLKNKTGLSKKETKQTLKIVELLKGASVSETLFDIINNIK